MSVISGVPTAEGFVIGSDGRNSRLNPPEILDDDAQKIFAIERPGMKLAYALFGTIRIGQSACDIIFDFEIEIVRAFNQVGRRTQWASYLKALTETLQASLKKAREASGKPFEAECDTIGTTISLGGFHERSQKLGHIRFEHGVHDTKVSTKPTRLVFVFLGAIRPYSIS